MYMIRRALFIVSSVALSVVLAGAAGQHATAAVSPILSTADFRQLGITPTNSGNPVIDLSAVAQIARKQLELDRDPDQILLGTAVVQPDGVTRTVWVAVYSGGDASQVSWGPPPGVVPTVDYTGIVVDSTTSEVLFSFRGGRQ